MRARQDARQLSLDVFVFIFVTVTTKEPPLRDATSPDGYAAIYIYILYGRHCLTHTTLRSAFCMVLATSTGTS